MFASSGAKDRFSSFVQDPSKDIFTLSATLTDDLELRNSLDIVVNRLKEGNILSAIKLSKLSCLFTWPLNLLYYL